MGVLGPRSYYQYVSESGTSYKMKRRNADMDAAGNNHASGSLPGMPIELKARRVHLKGDDGSRKSIDIGAPTNSLYISGGSCTIDGIGYTATGRTGEKDRGTNNE